MTDEERDGTPEQAPTEQARLLRAGRPRFRRPEYQSADRGGGGAELSGDLAVADALELAPDQRLALSRRKRADGENDTVELLAALSGLGRAGHRGGACKQLIGPGLGADHVQRRVADDREQPGAEVDVALVGAQGAVRLLQRYLDGVLRAGVGDDRGREGDEGRPVPSHDLLEGRRVSIPHQPDEAFVGLGRQGAAGDRS